MRARVRERDAVFCDMYCIYFDERVRMYMMNE